MGDTAGIFARNRAHGRIDLSVIARADRTRRQRVVEEGSLRIRLPEVSGTEAEAVIINTAGGIAGGDHFSIAIGTEEGARLAVLSAAAEKVYRAIDRASRIDVRLSVATGATLRWLPQETILFDGSKLHRSIDVDIADGGTLVMAESTIFGRSAMHETVRHGELLDRWRVRRSGKLVFADTLRLGSDIAALLARPAAGGGATALATVVIAPADETLARRARDCLAPCSTEAGVSVWNGIAVIRLCGTDAAHLRRDLVSALNHLCGTLPRLWTA
ncbi:urease accessory protein UreD [Pseudorhodoplanes sp.]|uniref:urease accessory protein UreD n=1 Tax=Pseudorhodoplanes sp. TaxID=1934341 RepID=UPI003D1060AE